MKSIVISNMMFEDLTSLTSKIYNKTHLADNDLLENLSKKEEQLHWTLLNEILLQLKLTLTDESQQGESFTLDFDILDEATELGMGIFDLIELLSNYRYELLLAYQELCEKNNFHSKNCNRLSNKTVRIFDEAILQTSIKYTKRHENHLSLAEKEILSLSAPIVPIKEDVSVMPLVGSLNSQRLDTIFNVTLPNVAEAKVETLILDFSGIYSFDTFVAGKIFDISKTLKILGVDSVITGLRPELAQTIVQLGLNLNTFTIYKDVKTALRNV